ncbi:META domain-containing protein [Hymenobacter rubripertinctus]|uniref:META domain-containing protein n=1 Tax=Hymenobacter rubripertinctus TaxID=2029981 RepID=A0A418QV82_9BACT|nr:META domain-containing protein [Hymenobacter rubripertinctus]RIY09058.1 META domain-containing protein [Hymenobacter rubripertinctus]
MKNTLLALLLAPALLSGCEPTKPTTPDATASAGTSRQPDGILNKYWKLMTLEGQPVTMAPDQEREAYFVLRDSSRVTGFGGCNALNGGYELNEQQQRLRFTNLLTTLKACPGPDTERGLLDVLNQTDNYTLRGDTLLLNVGRRSPLAVFQAVYFK